MSYSNFVRQQGSYLNSVMRSNSSRMQSHKRLTVGSGPGSWWLPASLQLKGVTRSKWMRAEAMRLESIRPTCNSSVEPLNALTAPLLSVRCSLLFQPRGKGASSVSLLVYLQRLTNRYRTSPASRCRLSACRLHRSPQDHGRMVRRSRSLRPW